LQKLLGTINWIRSLLGITTEELSPLFQLLKGDPDLSSPRQLTKTAQKALETVSDEINKSFATLQNPDLPLRLFLILRSFQPYALIGQCDVQEHRLWLL
ncbi:POK18 protein, partial [Machaerirhynchus nigripectus]|nr:POK18 protein [Machaerirhynchus nigripectus]NWV99433.1 POK18 protein [Machaerirhynchus nigripectus]